jgi:hypothetical protein
VERLVAEKLPLKIFLKLQSYFCMAIVISHLEEELLTGMQNGKQDLEALLHTLLRKDIKNLNCTQPHGGMELQTPQQITIIQNKISLISELLLKR